MGSKTVWAGEMWWLPGGLLLMFWLSLGAWGSDRPEDPGTRGGAQSLVVGVEEVDFSPYFRSSQSDAFGGYLRAFLDRFAIDRGYVLDLEIMPLKRLFLGFVDDDVDLFVPDNPTWSLPFKKRSEIFYSRDVAVALDGFAVLPGREDLQPGHGIDHVGTMLGFTVEPILEPSVREVMSIEHASGFESLFKALFLERIDAVYCNVAVARTILAGLGRDPGAISWSRTLPRFKSRFHISSRHQLLIEELDRWMAEHPAEVQDLKRSHGILAAEADAWGEPTDQPRLGSSIGRVK